MWKKRACSMLLAFMVAMTAIPFSAVPVFSQEAGTVQEAPEAEGTAESVRTEAVNASVPDEEKEAENEALTQEPAQAAEEAVEEETDTEDVSAASDSQSQEEKKLQEEAVPSDEAAAEDDEAASKAGDKADAAAEVTDDEQKAAEDGTDTSEESSPEADPDEILPSGQTDAPRGSDDVITAEPVTETVSEDAMAEGANEQYWVDLVSRDGKTIICPGEEIVLDAHVYRDPDGSAVSSGLKYKWEIVEGIDGGYAVLDDNIEGVVGDYPSATLKFSGIPDPGSEAFGYGVTVKVTVYDGKDSGTELTSGTIDTMLLDEYFEITPHRIDQIPVGEERTIPISIRYCGYYFDGFRYGYEVAWRFTYDENVLEVTDPDGNILDGTGTEPYEPGDGVNEPEITIRRLSGEWSDLEAEATFSYIDHNGVEHSKQYDWQDTFSKVYHFDAVENPEENGGRIWFDIDETRIFSDGTYSFDLHTEDIPEEYDVRVKVGHYDDSGLVEAYAEGQEYDFDGSKLTLYGEQIFQKGNYWFGLEVEAVSRQDGHVFCGDGFNGFESRETRAEYNLEDDKEFLPGWYDTVNHWEHVYVENADNPDGWDTDYEVTGVEILSQDPEEEGRDVIEIRKYYEDDDYSSDNYWWHYEGRSQGKADLQVNYKDIEGKEASYTFSIYVKKDVYGVSVSSEDGSTVARPGGTINLVTDVWHNSEDEEADGDTDDLVYTWNLKEVDEEVDPDTFAALQTADDGKSASVSFRAPEGFGENDRFELITEVFIYKGSVAEENKVGYDKIHLVMADRYVEIWPARIDSGVDVGQKQTITAEYRLYPGADGREYDLVGPEDGTVTYYWYYDDNAVQVFDKDGKQVGNEDDSGAYIGSDASTGASCDFTIYRRRQWDTEIQLKACWKDTRGDEEWEHWEERRFYLDGKDYRIWPDVEDDRIFNDGNPSYPVIIEGLSEEAVCGVDYNVDLKIGPLGEEGITPSFTEGVEYTFDGNTLSFDGEKLAASGLQDFDMFGAEFTLSLGEEPVWIEERDFCFREARVDYDFENDRDMLPGWDGTVNGRYNAHVENSANPDGQEMDYKVTNVEIVSDEPWDGEDGPVIDDFHRDENENDSSDYWWYYRVQSRGEAVLKVTYEDLDGREQDYSFVLRVGDDVYEVWIENDDQSGNILAGDSVEIYALGSHKYFDENGQYQEDSEGLSYTWSLESGEEWAELVPDPSDPSRATLITREKPSDMEWMNELVKVAVRVLDAQGQETAGYNNRDFWVHDEYDEIWPVELNSDLDMGSSIEDQKFEVRRYSLDKENYEVLNDSFDVRFEWSYDQNAFSITERKDGAEAELAPGDISSTDTFTLTRLREWGTDVNVRAVWSEYGEERDTFSNYWFDEKRYEIRFDNDDETIRDNEQKSFAVNTDELGQLDCEILFIVNYQAGDDDYPEMTMGQEYVVDASGTSVTVNGRLVDRLIRTSAVNPDEFYIGAGILFRGNLLDDSLRWCRVRMERSGKQEQEISASDLTISMYDTATASVDGAQGALTFTSGNTNVVTVNAETGKLTPVAPGSAQITVDAAETDDYLAASTTFTVTVERQSINAASVTGISNRTYNGAAQTQTPVVKLGSRTLAAGTDYTVSYSNNINAGTAAVTITGKGNYAGTVSKTFTIAKAAQSFSVSGAPSVESGKTTKINAAGAKETSTYYFVSSNTGIAAVAGDGTVTGINPGTASITISTPATANYNSATWTVTINVIKNLKKPGYCHFVKWNNKNYTGCRIAWNRAVGAEGYQTQLCWTNGSHESITNVGPNVLYRDCKVYANHVSLMRVRAFYTFNGQRIYGPWSNMEFITPSPTKLTCKNVSVGNDLKMKVSWPIIYGSNGYNVFITTNPNGKWSWNQSTAVKANALSAVITKYQGGKLKKNTRYYVRIVTRRKFKGVFCSVPMPAKNTYVGTFVIK